MIIITDIFFVMNECCIVSINKIKFINQLTSFIILLYIIKLKLFFSQLTNLKIQQHIQTILTKSKFLLQSKSNHIIFNFQIIKKTKQYKNKIICKQESKQIKLILITIISQRKHIKLIFYTLYIHQQLIKSILFGLGSYLLELYLSFIQNQILKKHNQFICNSLPINQPFMSFLDNNPFNRPSPNFSSSISTNNFYTNYDYISSNARSSEYQYGAKTTTNYFGSNVNKQSSEYKYSRAVQDSPFLNTTTNFLSSNVSLNKTNNYSSNAYTPFSAQKDYQQYDPLLNYSNKKYNYDYEPRISGPQLSYKSQQTYFKKDKYDNNFRKSNFQADIDIEIGRSRQNQGDLKYRTGTPEKEIKQILQNNPFQKSSLKSMQNKYSGSSAYNNLYDDIRVQTTNKYESLQFKPSYLSTSNVNAVPGFNTNDKYSLYENQKPYDKIETYSDRGSGQTFINKFDDLISSSDNNISQRQYSKRQSHKKQLPQIQQDILLQKSQKSKLSNPFQRDSNPFKTIKNSNPFQKDSHFYQTQQNDKKYSINSQKNSATYKKEIHSYGILQDKNSIKDYQDYDYGKPKIPLNQMQNSKNTQQEYKNVFNFKSSDDLKKYDQYIFKRSSKQQNEQQNKYTKKYDQRVQQQFQKWVNQQGKFSQKDLLNKDQIKNQNTDDDYLIQPISHSIKKDSTSSKNSFKLNIQMKNSISSKNQFDQKSQKLLKHQRQQFDWEQNQYPNPISQRKKQKQSVVTAKFDSFMKQSYQKSPINSTTTDLGNNKMVKTTILNNVEAKNKMIQKTQIKNLQRDEKFRFSGQRFTDSQPSQDGIDYNKLIYQQRKLHAQNPNFKKSLQVQAIEIKGTKTQNNYITDDKPSKSKTLFQPRLSNSLSQASSMQLNTQQKIDQKLNKYRYNYTKPPQESTNSKNLQTKKQQVKMNDFIDISLDQQNSHQVNQSFQFNSSLNHNYQPYLNLNSQNKETKRRSALKKRIQNDSFSYQRQVVSNNYYPEQQNHKSTQAAKLPSKAQQLIDQLSQSPQPKYSPSQNKQKYEFKTLDQFQKEYEYRMKNSGFDFQQDQFAESQKKLQFEKQDEKVFQRYNRNKNNKVLIPQFGYHQQQKDLEPSYKRQEIVKQEIPTNNNPKVIKLSQKQSFGKDITIAKEQKGPSLDKQQYDDRIDSNQLLVEQDDFVPTFKVKQASSFLNQYSLEQDSRGYNNLSLENHNQVNKSKENQHLKYSNRLSNQIQSQPQPPKRKQNIQQKVQRMKIYESSNEQYRTSGDYQQNARQINKKEDNFKSPFHKREYENNRKIVKEEYKTHKNNFVKQQEYKRQSIKGKNYYIEDQSEQDLQETKKYVSNGYKNHYQSEREQRRYKIKPQQKRQSSPQFYDQPRKSRNSYNEQPVRDSYEQYEYREQKVYKKSINQGTPNFKKKQNKKINYPSLLEFKGQIFHKIQIV